MTRKRGEDGFAPVFWEADGKRTQIFREGWARTLEEARVNALAENQRRGSGKRARHVTAVARVRRWPWQVLRKGKKPWLFALAEEPKLALEPKQAKSAWWTEKDRDLLEKIHGWVREIHGELFTKEAGS